MTQDKKESSSLENAHRDIVANRPSSLVKRALDDLTRLKTHPPSGLTILNVEDDENTLELIEELLREEFSRAQIISTQHVADALAMCLIHPPTLLITNVMMPGMTGIELIKALRNHKLEIPTIITSGYYTAERCEQDGIKIGGNTQFIKKSSTFTETIRHMVRSLLKTTRYNSQ